MSGRRLLVVALLGLAALLAPAAPASAAEPRPVVLVGAPGLSWSDIDPVATPTLWRLAEEGAVASLTVRSVRSRSCTVDGWLTLSAGRRAADLPGPCAEPGALDDDAVGDDKVVPRWQDYLAAARADSYDARPGTLAARLRAAGTCVEAVGPGAAIGAAEPEGRVVAPPTVPGRYSCPVVLVDGGTLAEDPELRPRSLQELEVTVAVAETTAPDALLLVAGVADGDSAVAPRALIASGPGVVPGLLTSPSTRQPGLVQLQDLTATLLERGGGDTADLTGRPVTVEADDAPTADRVADRVGLEVRAVTLRSVSPQVTGWLAAAFALWCVATAVLRRRRGAGAGLPPWLVGAGTAVASVPAATFVANLVPWWDAGAPALAFCATLAVVVALMTAAALAARARVPLGALGVVAAVTLTVLAGDVLAGSRLQLASVFGQNPTVGGRFYGLGNTSFALYGVAVLVVVTGVATTTRVRRPVAPALAGLVLGLALALEAHPSYGADFGGPPGLLLGGLVVLAAASGVRLTPVRVLVAVLGAGVLTAGVAVLDWLRPPSARTHLGEFVQTVVEGGATQVIGRKLAQNIENLGVAPLLVMTAAAAFLAVVLWRTGWRPSRAGGTVLRGAAVMGVVAFAVNDSGLVIPAFVALVLLPLLVAAPSAPD